MLKCQKGSFGHFFGVVFFNLCELGKSNQKMVVLRACVCVLDVYETLCNFWLHYYAVVGDIFDDGLIIFLRNNKCVNYVK